MMPSTVSRVAPGLAVLAVIACALPAPGGAQDIAAEDAEAPAIIVEGRRLRGQITVEQPPVAELDEADIAALGAGTISDILVALAPATGSAARGARAAGEPVYLVNGVRVSSPREFRNYPSEAVAKVEVYSEEVAQRFGYAPDQRVVNLVLKPGFRAITLDGELEAPDRGGFTRDEMSASFLAITGESRISANASRVHGSMLTDAERALGDGSRSLRPAATTSTVGASYARAVRSTGTSLAVNAAFTKDSAVSLLGRDGTSGAILRRDAGTDTLSLGGSVSTPFGPWLATFTSDAVHAVGTTRTEASGSTRADGTRSAVDTLVNAATLSGRALALPAGDVTVTLDAGFDWKRIASTSASAAAGDAALVRRRLAGGANIVIPVAERGGAWSALGDVTVTLGGGVADLSDFGALGNYSAGISWGVTDRLTLTATRIAREVAPTLAQLGAPLLVDRNVPALDPASGNDVLISVVSGGNRALRAETQGDWKLAGNWALPFWNGASLQIDYGRNRSRNVSATPYLSQAFEAAFPGRFTRAADGTLLAVDRRPVTLPTTRSDVISAGLSARGTIGAAPEVEPGTRGTAGAGGGGGAMRGPGRGFGGMPGSDAADPRPRYFANLTHSIQLANRITLAGGGLFLDQLAGDVLGAEPLARHATQLEAGLFWKGMGLRASGRFVGPAQLAGADGSAAGDLRFAALATLDLRLFADMAAVLDTSRPWAKGLRLSFVVDNVFDGQRRVTDALGRTPDAFAPDRIDTAGRIIGIDVRKSF